MLQDLDEDAIQVRGKRGIIQEDWMIQRTKLVHLWLHNRADHEAAMTALEEDLVDDYHSVTSWRRRKQATEVRSARRPACFSGYVMHVGGCAALCTSFASVFAWRLAMFNVFETGLF